MLELYIRKDKAKRLFGNPRRRWKDNIKMDLQGVQRGPWTGLTFRNLVSYIWDRRKITL